MDHAFSQRMSPWQGMKGREGVKPHRRCRSHHHGQPKLPSSPFHPSKIPRQGMTVQASMDVDFSNVSIHGWANTRHRTTNCLPTTLPPTIPSPSPLPSTIPNQSRPPEDDLQYLPSGEIMALATLGETTSPCCLKAHVQTKETKRQFLVGGAQKENKTLDLPCPDCGHPPQGWLLC